MTSVIWCSRSNRPTKELRRSRSVAKAEPPVSLPYTTFVKFANVHVLPSAPFCCGNMSEPGSDQHHSRDPIRKAADHPGSATNLQCVWDRCSSTFMSAFCIFSTDCRTSPSRCVRISFQSFLIALEIVFSFSCITFSTACFPFFWFRLSHYKQLETGPLSSALSQNVRNFPDVTRSYRSASLVTSSSREKTFPSWQNDKPMLILPHIYVSFMLDFEQTENKRQMCLCQTTSHHKF